MSMAENPVWYHKQITASAVIKPSAGTIHDLLIASGTGTVEVCDDADTGGEHIVFGPFTVSTVPLSLPLHRIMERGIAIIITGAATVSVGYT